MYQDLIRNELSEAAETLANFLKDDANIHAIQRAAVLLADSFKAGGKVLSCGNGGSHCDAMHFAEELTGRYRENRPGYPAIAISDVSHISCVSNDFGYDYVFSRYVEAVGREGDVLLGISTSGNSGNVIKAIAAAREKGMKVITLTGKDGGKMAGSADIEIRVPHFGYADRIQEIHIKVLCCQGKGIRNLLLFLCHLVVTILQRNVNIPAGFRLYHDTIHSCRDIHTVVFHIRIKRWRNRHTIR